MIAPSDKDLLRTLFDAVPSFVFVVDEDMRIIEYNAAAGELLKNRKNTVLRHRFGNELFCLHSQDNPGGCGRGADCKHCIIRNTAKEAFAGNRIVRRPANMVLLSGEERRQLYTLITVSPFSHEEIPLALLIVEDISEIVALQRLIPICAMCKKVRDDRNYWMAVEAYFKHHDQRNL